MDRSRGLTSRNKAVQLLQHHCLKNAVCNSADLPAGELVKSDWDRVIIATVWIFLIQATLF
jgi:hypothetical protein